MIEVELPRIAVLMAHEKIAFLVTQELRRLAIVQCLAEMLLEG